MSHHHVFLVFSQPVAGQESEYNRWYDEQHLADVLKVPGFVAAERFRLDAPLEGAPARSPAEGAPAQYLAVYDLSCADPGAVLAQMASIAGTPAMPLSPALDMAGVKTFLYRSITPRPADAPGASPA